MNDGALTNGRYIIPALWTAELGEYVFDLRLALGALIALMMADFWWGVREAVPQVLASDDAGSAVGQIRADANGNLQMFNGTTWKQINNS